MITQCQKLTQKKFADSRLYADRYPYKHIPLPETPTSTVQRVPGRLV